MNSEKLEKDATNVLGHKESNYWALLINQPGNLSLRSGSHPNQVHFLQSTDRIDSATLNSCRSTRSEKNHPWTESPIRTVGVSAKVANETASRTAQFEKSHLIGSFKPQITNDRCDQTVIASAAFAALSISYQIWILFCILLFRKSPRSNIFCSFLWLARFSVQLP
jgi:hypothetical protein